jgi:pyruvate ferredoxin oxidoreductase beta subunit
MASPAALLSGMRTALDVLEKKGRRKGKEKIHLVAIVGDGATADIGLATLSGAAERNVDAIYVCFDNEGYMNTGVQRSSQTPMMAWTTTTLTGKEQQKKNLPAIMAAHGVPYVATATAGFYDDLIHKLARARDMGEGFRYIHVLSPCPPGWRFPESKAIELARLAVETGLWILFEMVNGDLRISYRPKERKPVRDYLRIQGRFASLTSGQISQMQRDIDEKWAKVPE